MNSFFGIGFMELFFIAIIALIVLGPERLPGAIREVAKVFRQVRNISSEFTSQFSEELKVLDEINPQKILREIVDEEEPPAKQTTKKTSTSTKSTTQSKPDPAKNTASTKPADKAKSGDNADGASQAEGAAAISAAAANAAANNEDDTSSGDVEASGANTTHADTGEEAKPLAEKSTPKSPPTPRTAPKPNNQAVSRGTDVINQEAAEAPPENTILPPQAATPTNTTPDATKADTTTVESASVESASVESASVDTPGAAPQAETAAAQRQHDGEKPAANRNGAGNAAESGE